MQSVLGNTKPFNLANGNIPLDLNIVAVALISMMARLRQVPIRMCGGCKDICSSELKLLLHLPVTDDIIVGGEHLSINKTSSGVLTG